MNIFKKIIILITSISIAYPYNIITPRENIKTLLDESEMKYVSLMQWQHEQMEKVDPILVEIAEGLIMKFNVEYKKLLKKDVLVKQDISNLQKINKTYKKYYQTFQHKLKYTELPTYLEIQFEC